MQNNIRAISRVEKMASERDRSRRKLQDEMRRRHLSQQGKSKDRTRDTGRQQSHQISQEVDRGNRVVADELHRDHARQSEEPTAAMINEVGMDQISIPGSSQQAQVEADQREAQHHEDNADTCQQREATADPDGGVPHNLNDLVIPQLWSLEEIRARAGAHHHDH
ncbi:hypothetical protein JQ621_26305 [Bradyrhizobium manausense]|uniref:hypothetical protein n=1 Tax=Bradyrhizobium manausense TaxID=989370 RepID=UPI001BA66B2D|nr:hypothetical protein [Bradyrhizobium manausense]MBR1090989.1 hypothetical protein [Bradyrhizobium manausense]